MLRVLIRIDGHLDKSWAEWLKGFSFQHTDQDETVLNGMVIDQSALYGLIAKLRDLGVKLKAVEIKEAEGGHLTGENPVE